MRSIFVLAATAALTLAQDLDLSLLSSIEPVNVTVPSNLTSQTVVYNADAAASSVADSILSSDNSTSTVNVDSQVNIVSNSTAAVTNSTITKRSDCAAQPLGSGPVPTPDTASAFLADADIQASATGASIPSGYLPAFTNLAASSNAYGYMGFTNLDTYDVAACADDCNAINGCVSFNIYFERDPTEDPGTSCPDPSSTTNIKCVFWGGPVTTANTVNSGQWRDQFEVVIAGSNGYVNKTVDPEDGYSDAIYYGNAAILTPSDCSGNSYLVGESVFTSGVYDAGLCASACDALTTKAESNSTLSSCQYFNTFLISRNGASLAQYCRMYSQTIPAQFATYKGFTSGSDDYTVSYSYGFSSLNDTVGMTVQL